MEKEAEYAKLASDIPIKEFSTSLWTAEGLQENNIRNCPIMIHKRRD